MKYRGLRIAWSATCLIVCVLLIGLWMRSYWAHFDIRLPWSDHLLCSNRGWTQLLGDSDTFSNIRRAEFTIPYWLPTALAVASSAAPWLWPKRFTLRTLLIATTLIAMVLGLISYLAKPPAPPPLDVGDFPSAPVW